MIIRRFLLWSRTASAADRADGIGALARAYLYSDMRGTDRTDAHTAMIAALDDPSPMVRIALAEALAGSPDAPRAIITALAADQRDIASIVLRRSPILSDFELVDAAATGCLHIREAIAQRPAVSVGLAAALVEIGEVETVRALCANPGAELTDRLLMQVIERYGEDGAVREALLTRDLPVAARQAIAGAAARMLTAFTIGCGWMQEGRGTRLVREAGERSAIALGRAEDAPALVAHLIERAELTPALLLRAVLSRADAFVEAACAALPGLDPNRVAGLMRDRRSAGLPALYRRAGLPGVLQPVFMAALAAASAPTAQSWQGDGRLDRDLVRDVLEHCEAVGIDDAPLALLHRLDGEAAREEAARLAERMADQAALATLLEVAPDLLLPPPVGDEQPADSALDTDSAMFELGPDDRMMRAA